MPAQLAATMDDARNAVVGQLNIATPPSSPTIDGSTVVSISTFMDCSSTPPSSTASVGIHSRLRRDRHPSRTTPCCMPVACSDDSGAGIASDRNPYFGYYRLLPGPLSFRTGDPMPTAVNCRSSPDEHVLQHKAGAARAPDAVAE